MTKENFIKLINGCIRKDRACQKALYQHYYASSMAICLRYVDCRADAVNVLNMGFMRIFKNIRNFNKNMPFEQWVKDVLIGCIVDEHIDKFKLIVKQNTFPILSNEINFDNITLEYNDLILILQSIPAYYRIIYNFYVVELFTTVQIADLLCITEVTGEHLLIEARNYITAIITRLRPIQVVNQSSNSEGMSFASSNKAER